MASRIITKKGSGAPLASDLVHGELAVDTVNKRLYTENAGGTIIELGTSPSTIDINAGTIDGTVIGGSSAAAGSFTTISASGEIAANGGVAFGDNDKATFGDSDDLQIYHDGTNSFIDDQGTGSLVLQSNGAFTVIQNSSGVANARFDSAGAASLRYNGSEKLATTSTGIDVTGTVTADGLTVDGQIQTNIATTGRSTLAVLSNTAPLAVNNQATIQLRNSGQSAFISGESVQANAGMDIVLSSNDGVGTETVKARFAENGDISFYEDTGTTAKFFWDASAEALGIGTSSPQDELHIEANYPQLRIASNLNVLGSNNLVATVDGYATNGLAWRIGRVFGSADMQISNERSSAITFATGATEHARIDSSGNLLVGKSSSAFGTQGVELQDDRIWSTTSQAATSYFNRLIDDGDIVKFYKDGTTVGSIGVDNGDNLYITGNSSHAGLMCGSTEILPYKGTTLNDGVNDIGASSFRWKDLYLSGGVYLGGTGAANHLDDYEEGTWTPVMDGVTGIAVANGYYTKVGNVVHVWILLTSNSTLSGTPSNTISGLPFTSGLSEKSANVSVSRMFGFGLTTTDYIAGVDVTSINFGYVNGGNNANNFTLSGGSTYRLTLSATYRV